MIIAMRALCVYRSVKKPILRVFLFCTKITGAPTNWGLKEDKEEETLRRQQQSYIPDFESTYMGSYQDKPVDAMRFARHATPKTMSTTLLPVNKVNNDLHLRGSKKLRMPELMPEELSKVSV